MIRLRRAASLRLRQPARRLPGVHAYEGRGFGRRHRVRAFDELFEHRVVLKAGHDEYVPDQLILALVVAELGLARAAVWTASFDCGNPRTWVELGGRRR